MSSGSLPCLDLSAWISAGMDASCICYRSQFKVISSESPRHSNPVSASKDSFTVSEYLSLSKAGTVPDLPTYLLSVPCPLMGAGTVLLSPVYSQCPQQGLAHRRHSSNVCQVCKHTLTLGAGMCVHDHVQNLLQATNTVGTQVLTFFSEFTLNRIYIFKLNE